MAREKTKNQRNSTEPWIDLDEADFVAVGLRPRVPKPIPPVRSFDLDAAIGDIENIQALESPHVHFQRMNLSVAMTRPEANFWLTAILPGYYHAREVLKAVKAVASFDDEIDDLVIRLSAMNHRLPPEVVMALMALYGFRGMIDWMNGLTSLSCRMQLINGIRTFLLPYVTEADRDAVKPILQGWLDHDRFVVDGVSLDVMLLAVDLGMRGEVREAFKRLKPTIYSNDRRDVVLRLADADLLKAELQRKYTVIDTQALVRQCLAVGGVSCVDELARFAKNAGTKARAESLAMALTRVHAPEMAAGMLSLLRAGVAAHVARGWFLDNPVHATAGLAQFLDDPGPDGDAAREVLRSLRNDAPDVSVSLIPELEAVVPTGARSHATNPALSAMPAIRIGEQQLGEQHQLALFEALRRSTFEEPHPFVKALRTHAERRSLDAFAIALLDTWIGDKTPHAARWRLIGAGLLGGDGVVLKLGACIREWPGQSGHARAVLGLQCLLAVGTDEAFAQLASISAHCRYDALKAKANETMAALAVARGLTLDQLNDRIVPRCGLDRGGVRTFEYGARSYRFVLSGELKPMLRDETGKVSTDFPAPRASDDAAMGALAKADWAILKKQVAQISKAQAERLERAMVSGRRWSAAEFEELTLAHPILSLLAQRIIWTAHATDGGTPSTFRVTEDFTLADVHDEPWTLATDAFVSIIHPAAMSADERGAWGDILSDYEIIPPFRQLSREIYALTRAEEAALDLDRLRSEMFDSAVGLRILGHKRWERAGDRVRKTFDNHNVTVLVQVSYGASSTKYGIMLKIDRCTAFRGLHDTDDIPVGMNIPWGDVHTVVVSETIRDLLTVTTAK